MKTQILIQNRERHHKIFSRYGEVGNQIFRTSIFIFFKFLYFQQFSRNKIQLEKRKIKSVSPFPILSDWNVTM